MNSHMGGFHEAVEVLPVRVAMDLNEDVLAEWRDHGWITIKNDVTDLNWIEDKSFDMVVALDLIEHLEKRWGWWLLQEIDRICKSTAIIFTPRGFVDVMTYQSDLVESDLDLHLSGWTDQELRDLGYRTYIETCQYRLGLDATYEAIIGVKTYGTAVPALGIL